MSFFAGFVSGDFLFWALPKGLFFFFRFLKQIQVLQSGIGEVSVRFLLEDFLRFETTWDLVCELFVPKNLPSTTPEVATGKPNWDVGINLCHFPK